MSTEPLFGDSDSPEEVGPRSVLASLHQIHRIQQPVQLRDTSSETELVALDRSDVAPMAREGARYRVIGEIARGGMGLIMKAHDRDLGRDVAMKVLRKEFATRPDVVERFVEEAQIGGQLQHPGIVPVYEMGLHKDSLPYFTMKLVKGRTLSAMLGERKSATEDRPRFVSIFESICQTMSYAHVRGVVHRDIKPSNVMVGAFGQVLVVDWGLAKVRGQGGIEDERRARQKAKTEAKNEAQTIIATVRSGSGGSYSMVGSVIGTPQYMPPEQARGEVDTLDERSDVFALGAILCEILTGDPPYRGTDQDLVRQAAAADLTDAKARLDACGADPALISLTLQCLSPAPQARPRDAGEVAQAVQDHLATADERGRAAQIAASEASVRAVEERRSRRLATAVSITAVAALLAGGGAYLLISGSRAARASEARALVVGLMEEATRIRGGAASSGNLAEWSEAVLAAERAVDLAGPESDADEDTQEQARELLSEIREDHARAKEAADLDERARRTAARLDALRLEAWDLDPQALEARYNAVFLENGIDLGALSAEQAAERVAASGLAVRLATALDTWAAARLRVGLSAEPMRSIARAADRDPWRLALRAAEDAESLRQLAQSADVAALPLESASTLAAALAAAGDVTTARDVATRILIRHPNDLWTRSQAAIWLVTEEAGLVQEALRHSSAAVALGPDSSSAWANHAWVLRRAGDLAGAARACEKAIRLNDRNALALTQLGRVLLARREFDAASSTFRTAIELEPQLADARVGLGEALAGLGDAEAALRSFRKAASLEQRSARVRATLGRHLATMDDIPGALAELEEAVRLEPENTSYRSTLAAKLTDVGDYGGAREQEEAIIRLAPADRDAHGAVAWMSRELGDFERSESAYRAAIALDPSNRFTYSYLGRVLRCRGDLEGSVRQYRRAMIMSGSAPTESMVENVGYALFEAGRVHDGGDAERLLREAESTLMRTAEPTSSMRNTLGRIRQRRGDFRAAYSQFAAAARIDPTAGAKQRRQEARDMRDLARRVPGAAHGDHAPEDVEQMLQCGRLAYLSGYYAASAGYYEAAMETDREAAWNHRVLAIDAAAAAAGGFGEDGADQSADDIEHWRDLTASWLEQRVAELQTTLAEDPARRAADVNAAALYLLQSYVLTPMRTSEALARLSPRKRADLRKLWNRVEELLQTSRREMVKSRLALLGAKSAAERGEPVSSAVRALVSDSGASVDDRRIALNALAIADPAAALSAVRKLVDGDDPAARTAAFSVLGGARQKSLLPYLLEVSRREPAPENLIELMDAIAQTKGARWGPVQATGEPDTPPVPDRGDATSTWVADGAQIGEAWLELDYETKLRPAFVRVRETQAAGAVARIEAHNGSEWVTIWAGAAPTGGAPCWFSPMLRPVEFETDRLRLVLDTNRVAGWNHIDAVELSDGSRSLWASEARASSHYYSR